jgi:hypothetical protein
MTYTEHGRTSHETLREITGGKGEIKTMASVKVSTEEMLMERQDSRNNLGK